MRTQETFSTSALNLFRGIVRCNQICFVSKGVELGEDVRVRPLAIIEERVSIGSHTFIGCGCVIRPYTRIGRYCSFGHYTVIEGGWIGNHVGIHAQCHIAIDTSIGDNVFMAPFCITMNTRRIVHGRDLIEVIEPVVIKEAARLGAGVRLLPGVTVGKEAYVGAGTLVTRDVPEYTYFFGNPGMVRGKVPDEETIYPKERFK